MRKYASALALLVGMMAAPVAAHADTDQRGSHVQGWQMAGSDPADYEFARTAETLDGGAVVRLSSVGSTANGFGTMMQSIAATKYAGTRVRLSGMLKGNDISGWAGLWLRIDGETDVPLAFDNMGDRPVAGTTSWSRYDVVLDVAPNACGIAFGVLLSGTGSVDVSGLRFEQVGREVPVTGAPPVPVAPVNLDFSAE